MQDVRQTSANEHDAMAQMNMKPNVSRSQITAVGLLTLLVLGAGIVIAAVFGEFTMTDRGTNNAGQAATGTIGGAAGSTTSGVNPTPNNAMPGMDMGDAASSLIMPPGMIMTKDMTKAQMEDMAAVNPKLSTYTAPADARGDQPLTPTVENGVKVFHLDVSIITWNILPGKQVLVYAFNRQVPGPRIRVTEGDTVRIVVKNDLPDATTGHWHGMIVPNGMDGPADVTQPPIQPGATFPMNSQFSNRGRTSIIRTRMQTGNRLWACTAH